MRILVITPEQLPIPPVKGGSVESCVYNIFSRMSEKDQITLLSRAHDRLPRVSQDSPLKIIRISKAKRSAALRKVKGRSFDIIQIENRPTFIPAVRKAFPRTPIVLSLHSLTFMFQL